MLGYDPSDWYWRAEDGRLFSSKSNDLIANDDAAFTAWSEEGGIPTVWPRDDEGVQTQDALNAVLRPEVAPSPKAVTYKADIYRRCTDAEADAIEMALAAAPVRKRRLFEESQYLDHADEAFAFVQEAMIGMFGEDRAGALLAVSASA